MGCRFGVFRVSGVGFTVWGVGVGFGHGVWGRGVSSSWTVSARNRNPEPETRDPKPETVNPTPKP